MESCEAYQSGCRPRVYGMVAMVDGDGSGKAVLPASVWDGRKMTEGKRSLPTRRREAAMKGLQKAYRFRIYPNEEQRRQIEVTFAACVRVWNLGLELKKAAYDHDKTSLSYYDLNKMIPRWKEVLPWLKEASNPAMQQSLRNLDAAYKNFFRRVKEGKKPAGYPKFKSVRSGHRSYKVPAGGRKGPDGKVMPRTQTVRIVDEHHIVLPKMPKECRAVYCRGMQRELWDGFEGHILSATVSRTPSGKYYVSIGCEGVPEPTMPEGMVDVMGVRVGVGGITRSDGIEIESAHARRGLERRLRREQRRLSRKRPGSRNYAKQKARKARVEERIADIRSDHVHKATKQIVRDSKAVAVGRPKVGSMTKKVKGDGRKVQKRRNRAMLDSAMYMTTWRLKYKAEWYGREVVVLEGGLPWTRTCSACGEETGPTSPGVATWTCPSCGTTHDTAANAARNIQFEGAAELESRR